MIVHTMTPAEVAAAARKDLVHLQRKTAQEGVRMERRHKKNGRRDMLVGFGEYTSPARIQWMYVITVTKRRTVLYPMVWYFSRHGLHSLHISENGPPVYFAPHVLQRYRERFDPDADVLEALRNFFRRNHTVLAEPTPSERYGPHAITGALDDGLVFGIHDKEAGVALFNTYISSDMARPEQEILAMRLDVGRYFSRLTRGQAQTQAARYLHQIEDLLARLDRIQRSNEHSLDPAA